jgi:hypothetical protein
MLNASQFGFRALLSTRRQCMRFTDHVTLNLNNNMSTATVSLDIKKAFHTTWRLRLLYKLNNLKFSANLIKLISSFLSVSILFYPMGTGGSFPGGKAARA